MILIFLNFEQLEYFEREIIVDKNFLEDYFFVLPNYFPQPPRL